MPNSSQILSRTPALSRLEERVRFDLETIAHPRLEWLTPRIGPDGKPALDVLIIGAGQSGVATAFGLRRRRVTNVLAVDRAQRGLEGPWWTYARMHTLRSPKDYNGPDLDIASLAYPNWHIARYGAKDWEALGLIPTTAWGEYLLWVRDVIGLPVENQTEVVAIHPAVDGLFPVTLVGPGNRSRTIHTRKIVLATGQDGMGLWWMPPELDLLPVWLRAHAAHPIDFEGLNGKIVAVLGAGASAFDNAATALEHGAREVIIFCRRNRPQVIQPYRWLTFRGFLDHLGDLEDAWRWRFMRHILALREGFPQETWDRCAAHPNFRLVTAAPWSDVREDRGQVLIVTPKGQFRADFVIAGTGVEMDFGVRPELATFAHNIATWADKYTPPEDERDERLQRFPYLSANYSLTEKMLGETPWIEHIHLFTIASTMSFGPSGSSINAMTTVVPKLVSAISRGLFRDDVKDHWASLQAYETPQAIIPESRLE